MESVNCSLEQTSWFCHYLEYLVFSWVEDAVKDNNYIMCGIVGLLLADEAANVRYRIFDVVIAGCHRLAYLFLVLLLATLRLACAVVSNATIVVRRGLKLANPFLVLLI